MKGFASVLLVAALCAISTCDDKININFVSDTGATTFYDVHLSDSVESFKTNLARNLNKEANSFALLHTPDGHGKQEEVDDKKTFAENKIKNGSMLSIANVKKP